MTPPQDPFQGPRPTEGETHHGESTPNGSGDPKQQGFEMLKAKEICFILFCGVILFSGDFFETG